MQPQTHLPAKVYMYTYRYVCTSLHAHIHCEAQITQSKQIIYPKHLDINTHTYTQTGQKPTALMTLNIINQ